MWPFPKKPHPGHQINDTDRQESIETRQAKAEVRRMRLEIEKARLQVMLDKIAGNEKDDPIVQMFKDAIMPRIQGAMMQKSLSKDGAQAAAGETSPPNAEEPPQPAPLSPDQIAETANYILQQIPKRFLPSIKDKLNSISLNDAVAILKFLKKSLNTC